MEKRRLGEILVDVGVIDEHQLEIAMSEHQRIGGRLGEVLIDLGLCTEESISRALASQSGVEHYDLDKAEIDPAVTQYLPHELARRLQVVPVRLDRDALVVAMANPTDIVAIDEVERITDRFVSVVSASRRGVVRTIDRLYTHSQHGDDALERAIRQSIQEIESEDDSETSGGVVKLVDEILATAQRRDATDVHFEPDLNVVRVRFRVDGQLIQGPTLTGSLLGPLVARIKVLADLNIAEARLPQDGKIRLPIEGHEVDLRVSTFPSVHGESVVIRVLDSSGEQYRLDNLGIDHRGQHVLRRVASKPTGLILAAGPTGSGKTTSLYGLLRTINCGGRKVITLEDPVEYAMPLVTQCQINERAGLTFSAGLRSILRHDPDVVLVGEMRDAETASMALRAALTGHLVLSTLHTNDAVRTVTRLVDMGCEPFLISSCLSVVLAQRLVRLVCTDCAEVYEPSESDLAAAGIPHHPGAKYTRGIGCDRCNETGMRGREAVFEVLEVTPEIADLIAQGAPALELETAAAAAGMPNFREAAISKLQEGRIPIAEVSRVGSET